MDLNQEQRSVVTVTTLLLQSIILKVFAEIKVMNQQNRSFFQTAPHSSFAEPWLRWSAKPITSLQLGMDALKGKTCPIGYGKNKKEAIKKCLLNMGVTWRVTEVDHDEGYSDFTWWAEFGTLSTSGSDKHDATNRLLHLIIQ